MTGSVLTLPSRPVIVALVRDREGQARIADALRDRGEVVSVDSVADLEQAVRRHARAVRVIIATPYDVQNVAVAPRLARLRAFAPTASLIGYFRTGYSEEQEILAFARAQMSGMAFRHVTDTRLTLGAVISRSMHATVAEEVMEALRPRLGREAERFVAYGVLHAYEHVSVEELASAFGRHRKTITDHCIAAGLPAPAALLTWCRFFVLGYLLDNGEGEATIEDLALTLDFASPSALRTQLKRYTGRRALELRAAGALDAIAAAFFDARAFGRERRAPRLARTRHPGSPRLSIASDPESLGDDDAEGDEAFG